MTGSHRQTKSYDVIILGNHSKHSVPSMTNKSDPITDLYLCHKLALSL